MEIYKIQIIETLAVLIVYIATYYITKNFVNNSLKQTHFERGKRKLLIKAVHLITFLTALIFLSAIWGLKHSEIAVFIGTILTALGIAFFAQWSLLSNITSSILLFFNHPMRTGDTIKILDKEYPFEGKVLEMTYFFVYIKTENGEIITIPNSILFQKPILVIEKNLNQD